MRWALAGSAALHAALGAVCLLTFPGGPATDQPPIEVELVEQAPMQQGGMSAQEPAPSTPGRPTENGDAAAAAPASQQQRAAAPAINLGNGPRDLEGLTVRGENVVPPAPDAVFRNKPPAYPQAAAQAGAEGTVQLLIHVSAAGLPDRVLIAQTSGFRSLDRAARDAVQLWRFRPALAGGEPVPFDYVMNIRFSLGDR
jgi:protein TonB